MGLWDSRDLRDIAAVLGSLSWWFWSTRGIKNVRDFGRVRQKTIAIEVLAGPGDTKDNLNEGGGQKIFQKEREPL